MSGRDTPITQTTPYDPANQSEECNDYFKYYKADQMSEGLPPEDKLNLRELAIHRRAWIAGVRQGEKQMKQEITRNFQLAMWGHVL